MTNRWPLNKTFFWQKAPFFRLLFPLVIAICCYDRGWLPHGYPAIIATIVCGVCYALFVIFKRQATPGFFATGILYFFVFCFGWCACLQDDIRNNRQWFGHHPDTAVAYLVQVTDEPIAKERSWKIMVSLERQINAGREQPCIGPAFLYVYKSAGIFPVHKGDKLIIPGHWLPITNTGNPFEFDYAQFCRRKNLYYQQFAALQNLQVYKAHDNKKTGFITCIHLYCRRQLESYFTDSTAKGLMQAMLLGEESSFDPDLRQTYADTGVIHIVSISGSHVGILFLIITSLLFWIKGRKGEWIKYITGLAFVWLYVLMAGAPPSAMRSAIMFSIIALSMLFSKQSQPLNTLLAAAFILLTAKPSWLFAVGFQFSFCAVLSLLFFYRPLYHVWPSGNRAIRWLGQAVAGSIAAELLTAPLGIWYFHNFPLFFIPANILAALLLGFLSLAGGISVIAFSWLPPVAAGIAFIITKLISCFNFLVRILQSWNPRSFSHLQLSWLQLLMFYMLIAGVCYSLLRKRLAGTYIGATAAIMLLLCAGKYKSLQQSRMVVYNIPYKSCIEYIHGSHYALMNQDTIPGEPYALKQAHTGWMAWQKDDFIPPQPCFVINKQRILVLNDNIKTYNGAFPVDLLVIDGSLKTLSPSALLAAFHPRKIVAVPQPRWLIRKWKDSCRALNLPFHAVSTDGAFILE